MMFMDNAMQIINSYNENDALKAELAAAKAELAAEIERLKDLHRSILWFVEEHKKIKNCKKWMPLIEEKAKAALEDKP